MFFYQRAERMSRCLDTQSYMEYSEARQMSFCKYKKKTGSNQSIVSSVFLFNF